MVGDFGLERKVELQERTEHDLVVGILVGGKGSRIGGPKPLLKHPGGLTFVESMVEIARKVSDEVVLVGEIESLPLSVSDLPMLADVRENAGPLAGLCALLEYGAPGWVCLLACDLPLVTPAVLERLLGRISPKVDAVAFLRDPTRKTYHSCCALYHSRVLEVVRKELGDRRSLQSILGQIRTVAIIPNEVESVQLTNINTVEDLLKLEAL